MIMKHPRIRSQKIITDTLRDKMDNSFFCCLKKNLNAPRHSEHPPVWGKKCQNV